LALILTPGSRFTATHPVGNNMLLLMEQVISLPVVSGSVILVNYN